MTEVTYTKKEIAHIYWVMNGNEFLSQLFFYIVFFLFLLRLRSLLFQILVGVILFLIVFFYFLALRRALERYKEIGDDFLDEYEFKPYIGQKKTNFFVYIWKTKRMIVVLVVFVILMEVIILIIGNEIVSKFMEKVLLLW